MGVDLFFILSGFLITGILNTNKTLPWKSYIGRFYQRRARRILPPYIMLLILGTIFFGTEWMRHGYMYVVLMNFFQPLGIYQPAAFEPLWSLAVEEQFYLVWPLVVFFVDELTLARISAGLIVLAPILRWQCTPLFKLSWAIYMLTPFRMDCLAMGALLAYVWKHNRDLLERYGRWGLLVTVGAFGALGVMLRQPGFSLYANTAKANVWVYECSLFACTGVMVWALGGKSVGFLQWKPVMYIGQISYTIYLVHEGVLTVLADHMKGPGKIGLTALATTLAYASISWFVLEKPLLKGGHRTPTAGRDGREAFGEAA